MRKALYDSLVSHQIDSNGIIGFALPVKLLASRNKHLSYPCSGILVVLEQGADLSVNVAVFHRLRDDGSLDCPVEVKDVEFTYDVSLVKGD